jgi:hypothetical protein
MSHLLGSACEMPFHNKKPRQKTRSGVLKQYLLFEHDGNPVLIPLLQASDGQRVVLKPCEAAISDGSILVVDPRNAYQIGGASRPLVCP